MSAKLPNVQKPDNGLFQTAIAALSGAKGLRAVVRSWQAAFRGFGIRLNISSTSATIKDGDCDDRK